MSDFEIIYLILASLEKSLSIADPDDAAISAEYFRLPVCKWARLMKKLVNAGYIEGVTVIDASNMFYPFVKLIRPEITLGGLEYLESDIMKKAAKAAKGIA